MADPATKFDGPNKRYVHQFKRLTEYLEAVQEPIARKGGDAFEYLLETLVVMAVAAIEEYLKSLFAICSMYRQDECRQFIVKNGSPEERARAMTCNAGDVARMLEARVSFKKDAKRLTNTFQFLFGFELWNSGEEATIVKDLVKLRNIIVHSGGWPTNRHFEDIATAGLIECVNEKTGWYRLDLAKNFRVVTKALTTAGLIVGRLESRFQAEPKWHYSFEELQQVSKASPQGEGGDEADD